MARPISPANEVLLLVMLGELLINGPRFCVLAFVVASILVRVERLREEFDPGSPLPLTGHCGLP